MVGIGLLHIYYAVILLDGSNYIARGTDRRREATPPANEN